MRGIGLFFLLCGSLWAEMFLLDNGVKHPLPLLEGPRFNVSALEGFAHITRTRPTLTLLFEGEAYNHRHLNVRLATLEERPDYTVLTEYSEPLTPGRHRITFAGHTFTEALMLQVYYCGEWYGAVLEPMEKGGAEQPE